MQFVETYRKVEGCSTFGFLSGEVNHDSKVNILGMKGVNVKVQMVLGSTSHRVEEVSLELLYFLLLILFLLLLFNI
jgi:hypothetical protein